MFQSFREKEQLAGTQTRLIVSWATATSGCVLFVAAGLLMGFSDPKLEPQDEPRPVVFTSDLPEPPPPPEPEPIVDAEPPPPPPVSAPAHIPRKAEAPTSPPKELKAPAEIPEEAPKEGDAKDFAVAAAPPGEGDPAGRVGGTGISGTMVASISPTRPVTAGRPARRPVNLPEDAKPPRMLPASGAPSFPTEMKSAGKEGLVILKVVVRPDGRITQVQVLRGDEPFVTAATEWVKNTRWEPAIASDGEKLPVFKILRIPFRLRM